MVARDLVLAQLTGARYHVAHISTRNAVAMVEYAQRAGLPVTCEATPHHFALTDAEMLPYDSNYKMKPPLRSGLRRDAVVDGIASRRDQRDRHRSCAASRQREDAGVRALPVRHHRPGNGDRAGAGRSGAHRQDHAGSAWWSCSLPVRKR